MDNFERRITFHQDTQNVETGSRVILRLSLRYEALFGEIRVQRNLYTRFTVSDGKVNQFFEANINTF